MKGKLKGKPFRDAPGRCLKCGNELKLNKENAYCSRECEEQDMGYYTKTINSKIGAPK